MRRALLCASSEYQDSAFTPLQYPLSDADEIERLLGDSDLCGFDEIEVLKNAGRNDANEAVERLTADSEADDLILFYFSGHGKLARDGSVALVFADTKERLLLSTGLLDNQLRILFNASRARQRVIILDCCYSGAVGEEGFKRSSSDAVEALAQQVKGTFVLTASTKFQPAMECERAKGSAFTSCLIEGVRTGAAADKGTGCVTLAKLGEYLSREVPLRSNQQPKFWDFGGVGGIRFSHAPRQFDAQWTEQTLKRLQQLMAREQIDDSLFVELQQVLRGVRAAAPQERLLLIDDLVQKRLKPLPFLRKWEAGRDPDRRPLPDNPPAANSAPETEPRPQVVPWTPPADAPLREGPVTEETGAATESPPLPHQPAAMPGRIEGTLATASEGPTETPSIPFAEQDLEVENELTGNDSPPYPERRHLIASIIAVATGVGSAAYVPGYNPYGSRISEGIYLPLGIAFAIIQTALLRYLWSYLTKGTVRAGLLVVSLIGAFGFVSAIDGRSLSQLQGSFMLTLFSFGLLLLFLYLIRRGQVLEQRMKRTQPNSESAREG